MKKYLIILILFITLVGCSNQRKGKTQDMIIANKVPVESVQYKPNEQALDTDESTQEKQSNKNQPIVKQGNKLELPPGFPNNIISIIENADITNTYDDGESFSVGFR